METNESTVALTRKIQTIIVGCAILLSVTITISISWLLYEHTVTLLTENLKKRELAIVRTAAVQFDTRDLNELSVEEDYKKPEWGKVVKQLIKVRENNQEVVFAYILRKNPSDENTMLFVADSHSLDPYAKIDLDGNGVIDDADALTPPGTPYEDVPSEAFDGYIAPATNKELYEDQWGLLISGYAPIKDQNGATAAIVVVDIRADDFSKITTQTLLPFILFVTSLILILLFLTGFIIRIWNKRIELIAELDRQKDELLGIVSHQLATPVASLKWYTEMMIDGDLGKVSNEQKEHLSTMSEITVNLTDLVSMILDVSRIQLGRVKIEKQELDLNIFFKEIIKIIQPKAAERKIIFQKIIPKSLPNAMLDKRYTHMTIENLLSNAVKYTPEGGSVKFVVELKGKFLEIQVMDSGCGIPKKDQDKIFGKLFRASNVRNTVDGNGFGLFVAKGAVEAQGGKINFESEEGKGTKFFVQLPI